MSLLFLLTPGCGIQNHLGGGVKDAAPQQDTAPTQDTETATADSVDPCAIAPAAAGTVESIPECVGTAGPPVADPWMVTTLWTLPLPADQTSDWGARGPAVVGRLLDRDGDGVLDEVPAVVLPTFYGCPADCVLDVLDGATGALRWSWAPVSYIESTPVIADVDGDGWPDVVVVDASNRLTALDADGRLEWRSTARPDLIYGEPGRITVGDLDGDGLPEVVFDRFVVDGRNGDVLAELPITPGHNYNTPTVADVDLDGRSEIILDQAVWNADGTLRWRAEPYFDWGEGRLEGVFSAIVQADGDDHAEIAFLDQTLSVWDDDGTLLWSKILTKTSISGPMCAGDFDGGGVMELGVSVESELRVYRMDGTLAWAAPIVDHGSAGAGGVACSAFDFDGDGALELVIEDEDAITIFDGTTGSVRWADDNRLSNTWLEYPVIADVDADGHAEMLVAPFDTDHGPKVVLTVYRHAGSGWAPAPTSWPMYDYSSANIASNGTIASVPDPAWSTKGVFRGVPSAAASGTPGTPDPGVVVTDVCAGDCASEPIQIAVQAENRGYADLPAGLAVVLYAVAADGTRRELRSALLPELPWGHSAEGLVFTVDPADVGADALLVAIDPDGSVSDCEPGDDEAPVTLDCPA